MKALQLLSLVVSSVCCYSCYGTLVLDLDTDAAEKTVLSLGRDIEVGNPITFCVRFNLKAGLSTVNIFHNELKISFILRLSMNFGITILNNHVLRFEIPKQHGIKPFRWHHICFRSDQETFEVAIDGKQWSQNNHSKIKIEPTSFSQLYIGSMNNKWSYGDGSNLDGELSELNVWNKSLTNIKNLTKNCGKPEILPDTLNWSDINPSMVEGNHDEIEMKQICYQNDKESSYRLMLHMQNLDGAFHTCKTLNGTLAFPKSLIDYQSWNGKKS